jgi:hypothetical protein
LGFDQAELIEGAPAPNLPGRFANSDGRFVTSVLGVTRLAAPQLHVLLEATAVD